MAVDRKLLNSKQIAAFLGISIYTVRRLHSEGKLPTKKRPGIGISCWKHELIEWIGEGQCIKSPVVFDFNTEESASQGGAQMNILHKDWGKGGVYKRNYARKNKDGKEKKYSRWIVHFYANGEKKEKTLKWITSKAEAKRIFWEIQTSLLRGNATCNQSDETSFERFADDYLENYAKPKKRSWKTDENYLRRHLKKFFKNKKLSDISPRHIPDYIKKRLKQGVKNKTVNLELSLLRRMFNLAIKWDYGIQKNPVVTDFFLDDSNSKRNRVLTYEEQEKLIEQAAPHLKPIIKCGLHQAMRLGEVLKLKWTDIDFDKDEITIRSEISKNKKEGTIPIMPQFRSELEKLKKENSGQSEYIFLYDDPKTGEYRPITTIHNSFRAACRRADIKDLQFKDLRRTCATRLHEAGKDVLLVSRFLRHSSPGITTDVYIKSSLDLMKKELAELRTV